jgi:3-hydroxyisobutyrate dehydrogenase-like beta-hydroxyacid dehydrogenase
VHDQAKNWFDLAAAAKITIQSSQTSAIEKTLREVITANLGFVGLGVMGSRMVERLLAAGYQVTGYNRTRSKAQKLLGAGMKWGETPRAVAESAEITLSMVTNTEALVAVTHGVEGILAGLSAGKIYIDMSTVSPAASRAIAQQVKAKGAEMLDAPVSGSVITLEEGKLSIMAGGNRQAFEKVLPILQAIGPKVTHVGANGLAVSMKIATNLSLAVQMLAFSEGVLLAEKSGIARETAVEVLLNSVIARDQKPGHSGPGTGLSSGMTTRKRQGSRAGVFDAVFAQPFYKVQLFLHSYGRLQFSRGEILLLDFNMGSPQLFEFVQHLANPASSARRYLQQALVKRVEYAGHYDMIILQAIVRRFDMIFEIGEGYVILAEMMRMRYPLQGCYVHGKTRRFPGWNTLLPDILIALANGNA